MKNHSKVLFYIYFVQVISFLRIWSHLLKKSLMENFIFCVVLAMKNNIMTDSVRYEITNIGRFWKRD